LGPLLSEIKSSNFDKSQELIDKYGLLNLDLEKSSLGLKYFLPIVVGLLVFVFVFYSMNSSSSSTDYPEPDTQIESTPQVPTEPTETAPEEPSESEKKVMCLRMYGGGDMSAWETAQAECMLNGSQSACDCMVILSNN
jgi:hypothetical protein